LSAYVLDTLAKMPWLPELVLRAQDNAALRLALKGTSRAGTFVDAELDEYREAWSQEGALTAMLNWYRAMPLARAHKARIRMPPRVIWGDADSVLGPDMAEAETACCDQAEVMHMPIATHWLHHENPAAVSGLLNEFLTR
jgi:pimeloyl-ACP methyl ester carboxylesterase